MAGSTASSKPAVLFLGLAIAATFHLPAGAREVYKSPAPAYAPPPGAADLTVRVLRADGASLSGPARILLASGQGLLAEAFTDPKAHHEARFRKIPLGFIRLRIVADGLATADLKFLLEHPDRELRVTAYLRTGAQGRLGGDGWLPNLSVAASEHAAKAVDSLRQKEPGNSRREFEKLRATELGDSNLQYFAAVLDFREGNSGMALFHFSEAAYLNPGSDDPARAHAELLYRMGNYAEAAEELARMAEVHPQDWELEWEAASAAFLSEQYFKARVSAQAAADQGGAAALPAEYLLACADAMLGILPESRAAVAVVAAQSGEHALTSAARELLAALEGANAEAGNPAQAVARRLVAPGLFPAERLEPRVPVRLWAPPDVDATIPRMLQSAPCNAAEVLKQAGRSALVRLGQLREVAAKDQIEQAAVGITGRVTPLGHYTADYLPDVVVQPNGASAVEEFLAVIIPDPSPNFAVAQGRGGLVQVFEPAMQPNFTFACEGLTFWNDRPVWSLHFTQRPDRSTRLHAYTYSGRVFPAYIRGRGFVDASSGELLHMETDLRDPIPELWLEEEHLVVDYVPVKFQSAPEPYYLPSRAELYVNLRGQLYRVREDFKEYVRFDVDTRQEIRPPSGQN